jgi:probable phosphoglycerate mutase
LGTKKIYLLRHGQTDYNRQGIVQGSGVDSSLNILGRAQAQAFYDSYNNIPFDIVFTSALRRTIETIEPFLTQGIRHEQLAGLNEISWGAKEGQRITPEEDAYYHWLLQQWQEGRTDLRIEGGESPDEVAARQISAIEHILNAQANYVLVCMHGRAMRILLCQLLRYPLKCMDVFEHSNLCLYLLNYTGSMISIERFNDTAHLQHVQVSLPSLPVS